METTIAHLLYISTDGSLPTFGEERCPGGEVLFELRVRLVLAAVAAACRASPGPLERRGFIRAAAASLLVFTHDYDHRNLTLKPRDNGYDRGSQNAGLYGSGQKG